jgi:hypothetical protein
MTTIVADYLPERLRDWEVDETNVLPAPWGRSENPTQVVPSRTEEMPPFGPVGLAAFSSRVGVWTATTPPGIWLLDGRYDEKLACVPVRHMVGSVGPGIRQPMQLLCGTKDADS